MTCQHCRRCFYFRTPPTYPSCGRKFCSAKCHYKAATKKKTLTCRHCGVKFQRHLSQIKHRHSKYCSMKCLWGSSVTRFSGVKNPQWKGGVSSTLKRLRSSAKWSKWRKSVFTRDDFTCQNCFVKSGKGHAVFLEPHHIKPFAFYPRLRFTVSNGVTLCEKCHRNIHSGKRTREAKKWLNQHPLPL